MVEQNIALDSTGSPGVGSHVVRAYALSPYYPTAFSASGRARRCATAYREAGRFISGLRFACEADIWLKVQPIADRKRPPCSLFRPPVRFTFERRATM